MKLNEIKKMWAEDSACDFGIKGDKYSVDIAKLSVETPYLHCKYLDLYTHYSEIKCQYDSEMKVLIRDKWEYYSGNAPKEVYKEKKFGLDLTRAEIEKYVNADDDVRTMQGKIDYVVTTLSYLDSVIKMITYRHNQIKNAIDWEKFINGK